MSPELEEVFEIDFDKKRMAKNDRHVFAAPEMHGSVCYFVNRQTFTTSIRLVLEERKVEKPPRGPRKPLKYARQGYRIIETHEIVYRTLFVLDPKAGQFYFELQHPSGTTVVTREGGINRSRAMAILRKAGVAW